jgi:hypothetical protein
MCEVMAAVMVYFLILLTIQILTRLVSEARAMLLLREYSSRSLSENLARTAFGLFVAGRPLLDRPV